ncbi:hypothetical protein GJAV_G00055730 [Gymnothorax javanicus]|nr:hypothetical protein GJAV_G00055730 [Gymnothorax javanicus]
MRQMETDTLLRKASHTAPLRRPTVGKSRTGSTLGGKHQIVAVADSLVQGSSALRVQQLGLVEDFEGSTPVSLPYLSAWLNSEARSPAC